MYSLILSFTNLDLNWCCLVRESTARGSPHFLARKGAQRTKSAPLVAAPLATKQGSDRELSGLELDTCSIVYGSVASVAAAKSGAEVEDETPSQQVANQRNHFCCCISRALLPLLLLSLFRLEAAPSDTGVPPRQSETAHADPIREYTLASTS